MIKEAMEFILKQAKETKFFEQNGETFTNDQLVKLESPTRGSLEVQSLTGLVDFIKGDFDHDFDNDEALLIRIVDETQVIVSTKLNENKKRETVLNVMADVPEKTLDRYMDLEKFNIQLQAQFVPNDDSKNVLSIIGNLRNENVKNFGDDGITQMVEVKRGVTVADNEVVPNPVHLKPFRTFTEIAQPESPFVFRLKQYGDEVQAALFEADGGAWRNEARISIKEYLAEELSAEVDAGEVLIIG